MSLEDDLASIKKDYPFNLWRKLCNKRMPQYSEGNCHEAETILNDLTYGLMLLGLGAAESAKVGLFEVAVKAFNRLNEETDRFLIETVERVELFRLFDRIAAAVGLDTKKYGGGQGISSEWRAW